MLLILNRLLTCIKFNLSRNLVSPSVFGRSFLSLVAPLLHSILKVFYLVFTLSNLLNLDSLIHLHLLLVSNLF